MRFAFFCSLLLFPFLSAIAIGVERLKISQTWQQVESLMGIPYRRDGVQDREGFYRTFASPQKLFAPGLNCSGLVLQFSRILLGNNLSIAGARRDRTGDSGPYAPQGEDWDFGRDLILNVSEGFRRRVVLPQGFQFDLGHISANRGFNLHKQANWDRVLSRLSQESIYLASISKPWRKKQGYRLLHYHVGFIARLGPKRVWFYHSTPNSNAHRINIATKKGMARFQYQFRRSGFGEKFILIVEVQVMR